MPLLTSKQKKIALLNNRLSFRSEMESAHIKNDNDKVEFFRNKLIEISASIRAM